MHSTRLRKERWKLELPLDEARRNDEVISLADSQVLRWIDELNGVVDADMRARDIKRQIRAIRKEPNSILNKKKIKLLYSQLDEIQFKPDYLELIIDKKSDYYRACKGFSVNGVRYRRLLGTNGGIKNSTIVFVSERLADELRQRIENGRDPDKEMVTAKLEAHKALACSASIPVSMPRGVLVVPDCETHFLSDIVYLTDENEGEPEMEDRKDQEITVDASDGCGMMLPSLAERWSEELRLDYVVSGCCIRASFTKGMAFTFDFVDFAEKVAGGNYIVKDAWGDDVDIRGVELVLTTSMLKLWDSYTSCADWLAKSEENHYTFAITKSCPRELENERRTNYQYIQSYKLTDADIEELIAPTMNEIHDVLGGDWKKTVLFLKGSGLNEDNIGRQDDDIAKAIMIDHRMIDDPYVRSTVYQAIRNRINEAKTGVLNIHGNYSIVSGDPYALCQSIWGLEVTGLLKAGQIYNRYWAEYGADRLACFRSPMSTHSNIRLVHSFHDAETDYWYQYMNACTVFNAWDTAMAALNGMDYDGDLVMLTDNNVLVNKLIPQPALMCVQRNATKKVATEDDFIKSNIENFGNEIGQITNRITSMFEIQSRFNPESEEYKVLSYRIQCGQLHQQACIDRAKGIICKPMPKAWHDRHTVNKMEDPEMKKLYLNIVADRKPYFMRYIYPALMKEYNGYMRSVQRKSYKEFKISLEELLSMPEDQLSEDQENFLWYYRRLMPVGIGDCVMNKICRRFEEEFDGFVGKYNSETTFDYSLLKTSKEYSSARFRSIKSLMSEYNEQLRNYMAYVNRERIDKSESSQTISNINESFLRDCISICPNEEDLTNIVVDLCYKRSSTKRFAWDMCGHGIIQNLLEKNAYEISFPESAENGEFVYRGDRFTEKTVRIEEADEYRD